VKILVTGGNGFLGSYIVNALRERGEVVRVLDFISRDGPSDVEQFTADLVTSGNLEAAFDGVDVLVHLAASMRGRTDEMIHNTVEGSRRLLDAMTRTTTRCIVLASSFSVYDWSKLGTSMSEDDEILDQSTMQAYDGYAQAKTLQEQLTRDFARRNGWTLTVLRPAALWGRGVRGEFLIGKRIGMAQIVVAPSTPIRLVYIENAVDAFVLATRRTGGGELILNVIDDPQITSWRYAGIVQRRVGGVRVPLPYTLGLFTARLASLLTYGSRRLPYFLQPRRFEALHKPVACSSRRLREALGWTPRYTFDEALARTESQRA
jgi:nucleoside-diphosphate-sugar epimerase